MIKPISTSNQSCFDRISYIQGISNGYENNLVNAIIDDFKDNLAYEQVYKNGIETKLYDTWIYNGDKQNKIVGYKYLLSYPYKDIQFKIGDLIYWNSKDNDETYFPWLLTSFDKQHYYEAIGKIYLCNNTIKSIKGGKLWQKPCVFSDKYTGLNIDEGVKGVPQISADIKISTQLDKDTANIKANDRFLFNGVAYQVNQVNNHIIVDKDDYYIDLYMFETQIQPNDDIINNIANATGIINPDLTETLVQPNDGDSKRIIEGGFVDYTVYKYVNGVQNTDTFTITASGVPDVAYTLTINSANNFRVTCLQQINIPLTINCTNDISGEITKFEITLAGKW